MTASRHTSSTRPSGPERRHGHDDDYSGPERRRQASTSERITQARLGLLESQQADMAVTIREATAAALRDVLTDPKVLGAIWDAALSQAQRGAAERTGRWIWGSAKLVLSKWLLIAAIVLVVAQVSGWPVAAKVFGLVKGPP